jgi:transposase
VPKEHFGEEAEGILTVDRYSAYKALLGSGRVMLAYCWAHVRRDFLGVGRRWPEQESWALLWVKRIGELYRLNDQRLLLEEQPWEYAEADTRLREAVRRMALQRDEELGSKELPRPACKALESLQKHWGGLTVFVEHPQVPMDNNYAERLVRNPVVGRKNYYGSHSLWSACLAAMLFSVFQTLVRWGINPKLWLTAYLEACAASGGQAPENVERFIPWKMTEQELSAYRSYEPPRFDTS